jgi:hypothetical protein
MKSYEKTFTQSLCYFTSNKHYGNKSCIRFKYSLQIADIKTQYNFHPIERHSSAVAFQEGNYNANSCKGVFSVYVMGAFVSQSDVTTLPNGYSFFIVIASNYRTSLIGNTNIVANLRQYLAETQVVFYLY